MVSEYLTPFLNIALMAFNFISAVILPVIQFLFGLGEVMFAKIFIVCILTIFLYKAAVKLVKSPNFAFIIAFIVSLLGIRIIPNSVFVSLMAGWYAFALLGVFIAFTIFFRTVWWQRRTIMFVLIVLFTAFWYFYQRNSAYIILASILLLFLLLDSPIHKILAPLREIGEKTKKLDLEIKLKQKKINDALAAGATEDELKILQKELDELASEKSKL